MTEVVKAECLTRVVQVVPSLAEREGKGGLFSWHEVAILENPLHPLDHRLVTNGDLPIGRDQLVRAALPMLQGNGPLQVAFDFHKTTHDSQRGSVLQLHPVVSG